MKDINKCQYWAPISFKIFENNNFNFNVFSEITKSFVEQSLDWQFPVPMKVSMWYIRKRWTTIWRQLWRLSTAVGWFNSKEILKNCQFFFLELVKCFGQYVKIKVTFWFWFEFLNKYWTCFFFLLKKSNLNTSFDFLFILFQNI